MKQALKAATWVCTLIAVVFFWLSIRSETDQMMYSIIALAIWGVGMLFNYILKKHKSKSDED